MLGSVRQKAVGGAIRGADKLQVIPILGIVARYRGPMTILICPLYAGFLIIDAPLSFNTGIEGVFNRPYLTDSIGHFKQGAMTASPGKNNALMCRTDVERLRQCFQRQITIGYHVGNFIQHYKAQLGAGSHPPGVLPGFHAGGSVRFTVLCLPGEPRRHRLELYSCGLQ